MINAIFQGPFITILTIVVFFVIRNGNVATAKRRPWTEQDEARRIQQIMEAERMEYEIEQRAQSAVIAVDDSEIPRKDHHDHLITEAYHYKKEAISPVTLPTTAATTSDNDYWCYHCTSPLNIMSGDMQRAIEKFLRIRRTVYPIHVKNMRCSEPRTAFTIRGCAETFGAINDKLLEARGDNTCQKLHDQLDIQECICRHRRYCYPGAKRRFFGSSAETIFMASAPTDKLLSIFCGILLISIKLILYDHF
ncbi:unnamed protein product [Onchocerca ochengi]|uniref:Protein sleepless n=1 Tax=Onchocerca ochengi TaxID=42157 RepID=A0A182E7W1_ONCOC|nr:unnamed protein product [Onchocerca ochengi]